MWCISTSYSVPQTEHGISSVKCERVLKNFSFKGSVIVLSRIKSNFIGGYLEVSEFKAVDSILRSRRGFSGCPVRQVTA